MLSPERNGRLTASDHAAALGLNPYQSRQELWRRWNGLAEPHDENTIFVTHTIPNLVSQNLNFRDLQA